MPDLSYQPGLVVPEGLSGLLVLFDYGGPDRELVLGIKHTRGVTAVPALADRLSAELRALPWTSPVAVTWIPTTAARRRDRGYDQSLLLAKAVGRRLGLPCRRLLRRTGRAQEGLGAVARRSGPQIWATCSFRGAVLVVDDVVTTGATMAAAAAALRGAGASHVYGAALAISRARTIR